MNLSAKLHQAIDNSPLVLFRIIYGLLITLEAWGAIATGWVQRVFIEPKINFPFIDFSFLQPLDGNGMIYYYLIMGAFGLMVMLGYRFRFAMIAYALMWAAVYLMQKTSYNNHYYLLMVFNFVFCFVPAHHYASLDVRRNPTLKRNYCPLWAVWIFKAMILIVYFYSAVAKMYPEWLEGIPVKIWFNAKADYWLVGPLLTKEWFQYFVAWGGITFDLLIGPALLWKKSRKVAFFASLFFHLFNSAVFQVGVFPYLGISFAIFFFEAETIRKLFLKRKPSFVKGSEKIYSSTQGLTTLVFVLFLGVQFLLPLRHWYFKGDVNWTEEGHRLSWHMMLRVKSGVVGLSITDNESGKRMRVNLEEHLSPKQQRVIATRPDMLWQFVQYLKQHYKEEGMGNISIYANGWVSLNGAPAKPLYDPKFDLVKAEWNAFKENKWVLRD